MGNSFRPTTTTRVPAQETVRVASDGGEDELSAKEFEEGFQEIKSRTNEDPGGVYSSPQKADHAFEVVDEADSWSDATGAESSIVSSNTFADDLNRTGKGNVKVLSKVSPGEIERGAVDLDAQEALDVMDELNELGMSTEARRDVCAQLTENLAASYNGDSVELSGAERELLANAKYVGTTENVTSGEMGVFTQERGVGSGDIREAFESHGSIAVVERGNQRGYQLIDRVKARDAGELPDSVDVDSFTEKIEAITNDTGVGKYASNGDVEQVRVIESQDELDAYLSGEYTRTVTSGASVNRNARPERALSADEMQVVVDEQVLEFKQNGEKFNRGDFVTKVAERMGYDATDNNPVYGEVELPEQNVRVATVKSGSTWEMTNPLRTSDQVGNEHISAEIDAEGLDRPIQRDESRLIIVDDTSESFAESGDAKMISAERVNQIPSQGGSESYKWKQSSADKVEAKAEAKKGKLAVNGTDHLETTEFDESKSVAVEGVSSIEDANRAPVDSVPSMQEIASRVGKELELEKGGMVVYKPTQESGGMNEYGDVLEARVEAAMAGTEMKTDEDFASPDHPFIAAESKLYDKSTLEADLGENNLQENPLVRSQEEYSASGKRGSVKYDAEREGELELAAQDIRFIRGYHDTSVVARESITPEMVDGVMERQNLSSKEVYGRDFENNPQEAKAVRSLRESGDMEGWRSQLSDQFVDRVGKVTAGVVTSGKEIVDSGKMSVKRKYRYSFKGEFRSVESEKSEESPVGSDPSRPSNRSGRQSSTHD